MDFLSSLNSWEFTAPLIGAILVWFGNEWRKQYWELYKRKEENYKLLLKCVVGFYKGAEDPDLQKEFLNQINQCWLYCPDNVIKKGYNFLYSIQEGVEDLTDKQRDKALGEFISAIRNDIYPKWKIFKKTDLTSEDFKIYRIKKKNVI